MQVLINIKWQNGYLEYALLEGQVRISIHQWTILDEIKEQYIEPKRSIRLVMNYLKSVGLRYVLMKIRSRLNEAGRNRKFLAAGFGIVTETANDSFSIGSHHPISPTCTNYR